MRKLLLIPSLLLIFWHLSAQRPYKPTPEDLKHLLTTKTYVVLDDSPMSDFNFEIKDAMPKEWNITKFDFISLKDFEEKSTDPSSSFIYSSYVTFDKDKTESRYIYLHLSMGGDNKTINDLRDIISVPLGYSTADPDNYNYKIALMIRFMQKHISLLMSKPELISSNMFQHYNENMSDVKSKVLYLIEDELAKDVNSAARIKQVYPHQFKLVTRDEIKEAIENRDENVVFLHKVGPEGKKLKARSYKILMGAADADFYYFDYHMISDKNQDGFLSSDFKKIAR
jgi:hypothetical protein